MILITWLDDRNLVQMLGCGKYCIVYTAEHRTQSCLIFRGEGFYLENTIVLGYLKNPNRLQGLVVLNAVLS